MIPGAGTPRRSAGAKSPLGKVLAFVSSLDMLQLGMLLFLAAVGLAYNAGDGRIEQCRNHALSEGKNPNDWE